MDERDRRRAEAALEAARRAQRHVAYFGDGWLLIEAAVDALAKAVEEIGEQLSGTLQQPGVSATTRAAHPEIPWRAIAGLRNFLAHKYVSNDPQRLKDVVERDVRALIPQLEVLLAESGAESRGAPPD